MDNYLLIHAGEDNCVMPLPNRELDRLLDSPEEYAGIKQFADLAFLGANPDPNYWPEGTGLLLRVEAVQPKPAGKYVLP